MNRILKNCGVNFERRGKKEIIKKHVESTGESLNTFVNIAIDEKMERDNQSKNT